jgi:radical SAM protein with 4Fe4S-binding SPASM domain
MIKKHSLERFHRKMRDKAAAEGIPIFGGFELTPRCNLSCRMCYIKYEDASGKKELTARQWIELGKAAADSGMLIAFLTGGEPLIREDLREIYAGFNRMGLRLNLFTNGTLIDEEFVKWLSQAPPAGVDVTLYGASEKTYEALCGNKNSYKKVINGIELLIKYNINIRIKTILVNTNACDYGKMREMAKSYGVEFLHTMLVHGSRVRGISDIGDERLTPEEICSHTVRDMDQYDCGEVDTGRMEENYRRLPPMFCSAGKSSFFIGWKGDMIPCPLFTGSWPQPLETGFSKAWEEVRQETGSIPGAEECRDCSSRVFCPVCPPRLKLETGSYKGRSDYICSLARQRERLYGEAVKKFKRETV